MKATCDKCGTDFESIDSIAPCPACGELQRVATLRKDSAAAPGNSPLDHAWPFILAMVLLGAGWIWWSSGGARLTQSAMDSLDPGIRLEEAEAALGPDHTAVMAIGDTAVHQWIEGDGDDTKSIVLTFREGKLVDKAGTNLRD